MQVFKFGGASIKNAEAIKNLGKILKKFETTKTVVVISAMGKTTNALESILGSLLLAQKFETDLDRIKQDHLKVCEELSLSNTETSEIHKIFHKLEEAIDHFDAKQFDFHYDQIVSFGEKLSTKIISLFLQNCKLSVKIQSAEHLIRTDDSHRDALVQWEQTAQQVKSHLTKAFEQFNFVITQGFIGQSLAGATTTLGREGSDFSAAIIAKGLEADSVTIWKDVDGVFNADPKQIPDAFLIPELTYQEAAEMTFYGASVIHPKTIKPLANAGIPLLVRSFENTDHSGTKIHSFNHKHVPSCVIVKEKQSLLTFKMHDYTFTHEAMLGKIFNTLNKHHIKINMMQNSALSFSVCVNDDLQRLQLFMEELKEDFSILYNQKLKLFTLKNYTEELIQKYRSNQQILMEQKTRKNYQMVVKS